MRYLSLCSGIEAASVAWEPLGWKPVAFAEIEQFPAAVLAHHYPDVPNLGDITQIDGRLYNGMVDLVVAGTPCQDFSQAGYRKGLAGERSGLAIEFVRLVREICPRWIVWENVPGAFSTSGGRDFGTFIGALDKCGYSVSWRVLDAQYFGVPQQRRRIYVVGYIGDWRHSAAVLFEQDCLQRDFTENGKAKRKAAAIIPYRDRTKDKNIIARCLTKTCFSSSFLTESFVATSDGIRYLTVIERERLMGFPDNYTNVCRASVLKRSQALGNSMAVPVMRWIGERIARVEAGGGD